MSQEFEIKRLSLEEQRDRLQQQLDNLKEELSAKLNMANQEVPERVRFGSAREAPRKHPSTHVTIPLLVSAGVPPPGAGEGERAEPGFGSDADQLPEGHAGEAQDRTGRDEIPGPRDQQPAN